jgi:hypothetical protein
MTVVPIPSVASEMLAQSDDFQTSMRSYLSSIAQFMRVKVDLGASDITAVPSGP